MNKFFKNEIQPLVDELDKIIGEDKQVCPTCEGKTYTIEQDEDDTYQAPCMDCEETWNVNK